MSGLLTKINERLPFTKTERIIIVIVVLMHALPALEFLHFATRPQKMDDERVMANLVSPDTTPKKSQQAPAPAPAPSPPKPKEAKEEPKKKAVEERSSQNPTPPPPENASQQQKSESPSQNQLQNAAVAPSTAGGASGTPIQTDIGKLIVVYLPDADAYYPSFSKRSGEQGTVVVRLIISETGEVEDVALLQSSSYPRLDRAAADIGKRYRFKPFLVNGSPQRISTNLLIKFNLKN